MKFQSLSLPAFAVSIFVVSAPADARPVTTADLSGKMICWSGGVIQTFEADGKTGSSQYFSGTWSVGANGVRIDWTDGGANLDIEIQSDGTFTSEIVGSGGSQKGTGKTCQGKLLSYADVEGKKLCWVGGETETYFPGGRFINSSDGEGVISTTKDNAFREWKLKEIR